MSHRKISSVAAAALIGITCASTEVLARVVYHGGVHAGGYHRVYHGAYVRRGIGVGVGAAAVGASAVGAAAVGGAIYNSTQCGYYPAPPCY